MVVSARATGLMPSQFFDDKLIRFSYFSGDGHILEDELVSDLAAARRCSAAFEAVWERSIPHAEYRPT